MLVVINLRYSLHHHKFTMASHVLPNSLYVTYLVIWYCRIAVTKQKPLLNAEQSV